jgi:hypothetical protein
MVEVGVGDAPVSRPGGAQRRWALWFGFRGDGGTSEQQATIRARRDLRGGAAHRRRSNGSAAELGKAATVRARARRGADVLYRRCAGDRGKCPIFR